MSDIAVLGCGPAGLLVALAVEQAGHTPHIYSIKKKSVIPGSQHLHGPIPELTPMYPEGTINFVRIGTARGYAQKLYGDPDQATGWEHYLQVFPSWNVLKAYDRLWDTFGDRVKDVKLDFDIVRNIALGHTVTISTVPAQALCYRHSEHTFEGKPYFLKQLPTPPGDEEHEIVVYNGLLADDWYRWSILGGICSIEYAKIPDTGHDKMGLKAISNNCNCWPTIHRAGRWAKWKHGVTMYNAYQKAVEIMGMI